MADSSQSSEATTILIDVELEDTIKVQTNKVFCIKGISIPERYHLRMAKTGLLTRFLDLIELESPKTKLIQRILKQYNINIPPEYFAGLLQDDLLESLLNLVDDVNHEQQVLRTHYFQTALKTTCKRRNTEENSVHQRKSKKQKIATEDNISD